MRIQGRLSAWSRPVKMTFLTGRGGGPVHPHGFLYLVAIMDWATRHVLAWRLSNTMDPGFCVEALSQHTASPSLGIGQHLADVPDRLEVDASGSEVSREVPSGSRCPEPGRRPSLFNRWFSRSSSFRRLA